ncbi:hypothetical protein D0Y65_036868 [Glycine soja]|uniref:Uncharacterized protein n=1 Tax=Glycine soja TaxID=3848 RepID=A0A445HGK4_GLYSO|nr:hypothetical protein D0Y65_036868 [Glycine soja]
MMINLTFHGFETRNRIKTPLGYPLIFTKGGNHILIFRVTRTVYYLSLVIVLMTVVSCFPYLCMFSKFD